MKRFAIVAAMFAAACGYSEDKFNEEATEAACAAFVACTDFFTDVDACLTAGDDDTSEAVECVNYDATNAAACVEGLEAAAAACTDTTDGFDYPTACTNVCDEEADTDADTDTDTDTDTDSDSDTTAM